ncbi:unnamed protein product [Ilex paraguariensis]|uniref:Cytochrome P450 n=1 Tax=Ilex paraguariensis TaxID=185542 RepID=A0ABC8UR28_9AQUA
MTFKFLLEKSRNLPPRPVPTLPVIGHLHLLKQPLHRTLHKLSEKAGPIISLRFGNRLVVVVSSSSAAEECFTKNDIVLANRPRFTIGKYIGYNYSTIGGSSYGDHWRNLRRLGTLEIFSASRLNMFLSTRQDEIKRLLCYLRQNSVNGGFAKVDLRSKLSELSFNVIMRMISGKRYGEDEGNEEAKHFRGLTAEVFRCAGMSNLGDYLPVLRWIDYKGFEKNLANLGEKMDVFLQGLIDENRHDINSRNSMISHLLSLQQSQPDYYTDELIKGVMLVCVLPYIALWLN